MLTVEVLYPEVANLYGELANIRYLARSCPGTEVIETSLKERPRFLDADAGIDLAYLGCMSEEAQDIVLEKLLPLRNEIEASIEAGQHLLATGNALELFGSRIACAQGDNVVCLGLFAFHAERDMEQRFNSLYIGDYQGIPVVGFKSQFSHGFYDGEVAPLFDTERGPGFHPDIRPEGVRYKNFKATYLIGPLLVLNPPFLVQLLRELGVDDAHPAHEEAALAAYERRLNEYREPQRGFTY